MPFRLAVLAAGALALAAIPCLATPQRPFLTLAEAQARVAADHPDLQRFLPQQDALAAEARAADLAPPLTVRAELADFLGSGRLQAGRSAELTLSLEGLLERGGKREARRALAAARLDALGPRRAAAQLDLFAETTRRYLELAALQARQPLMAADLEERRRIARAARQRFLAGAAPEASALAAEAEVARIEAELAASAQRQRAAWHRLSLLWGGNTTDGAMPVLEAVPATRPTLPSLESLRAEIGRHPSLLAFADEARVQDARYRLAASSARADLAWSLGLRHLRAEGDTGLVATLSLPLGSPRRAEPAIAEARALQAELVLARESAARALEAAATEAWWQVEAQGLRAERLEGAVLPRLERAAAGAERAYRAGALGYLEWAALQSEVTAARLALLEARVALQLALIELQRLTAESWVVPAMPHGEHE